MRHLLEPPGLLLDCGLVTGIGFRSLRKRTPARLCSIFQRARALVPELSEARGGSAAEDAYDVRAELFEDDVADGRGDERAAEAHERRVGADAVVAGRAALP